MKRLLLVPVIAAGAVAGLAAPASAVEVCRDVRVDLIQDWTFCVSGNAAIDTSDGLTATASGGLYCNVGRDECEAANVSVGSTGATIDPVAVYVDGSRIV